MKTPNQIENALKRAADEFIGNIRDDYSRRTVDNARATFQRLREEEGLKSRSRLLSGDISKLNKDETTILGLALLPAQHSNIANVCAFADSCADSCVAFSGNGSFPNVYRARLARTRLVVEHPYDFIVLLFTELMQATTEHKKLAVRLNTYSDIRWERVAPWLFEIFRGVQFYDYTKHPVSSRPESSRPFNYHLTYSVSERTRAREINNAADIGRPLAVVVAIRSGKTKSGEMRPIPETWAGMPTIDGDISDARWTTPTGSVVILRRKHTLDANAPMIQTAAKLEKKGQQ